MKIFSRFISALLIAVIISISPLSILEELRAEDSTLGTPMIIASSDTYDLPAPYSFVELSKDVSYPVLRGIRIDPDNAFKLEFIIDTKDSQKIDKKQASLLVEYFLAALTIPEDDLWVNLSPYEEDQIAPTSLAITQLGKDLLGQDYLLKQLTSSLIYPDSELGSLYWKQVYDQVQKAFGTTNIPISTFNKIWIVPDYAQVLEDDNIAVIKEAKLKALHEADYTAMQHSMDKG